MSKIFRILMITGSVLMLAACATAAENTKPSDDKVVVMDDLATFGNRPFDSHCVSQHVCF